MEPIRINELIERCVQFFKDNCYTTGRIYKYRSLWKNGIIKYMCDLGTDLYTPEIGAAFKETCIFEGMVRPQEREKIRSIQVLDDMLLRGTIRKRCVTPIVHVLYGEIGTAMGRLITHLTLLRRSDKTISDYRLYLSEFLNYLSDHGTTRLEEITESQILSFIGAHPTNKVSIVSALRVLFRFWDEQKILKGCFRELFDTYKLRHPEPIPSFYSQNEVRQILASISRSSPVGKRDYAMTLLAALLGLRASDIANLKLDDIDWDRNLIRIVMVKTRKEIELPLLPEIGNAIIDYFKNGRPKSDVQNVFLSGKAPYTGATKNIVCTAIRNIISQSGVVVTGKKQGPHSLRHSLATSMMKEGAPVPSISEALGHRSTETTMKYIKIGIQSLQMCSLDVPDVPESFYKQRGGAFYG